MPARKRDEVEIKQYIVRDWSRLYVRECETRKFEMDQFAYETLILSENGDAAGIGCVLVSKLNIRYWDEIKYKSDSFFVSGPMNVTIEYLYEENQ